MTVKQNLDKISGITYHIKSIRNIHKNELNILVDTPLKKEKYIYC